MMFEINKTLLYISLAATFYVGYSLGKKRERIRQNIGL